MQDQLKLAAKPQRKAKERQLEQAEQRAYDRAYSSTRKEIAKAEGHAAGVRDAAGGNDPAVERARQRALNLSPPEGTAGSQKVSSVATNQPERSRQRVTISARGRQFDVMDPDWYGMTPDQQAAYLDAYEKEEAKPKDEMTASKIALGVLDHVDSEGAKWSQEKAQLLSVIEELVARVDALEQQDRTHEINASQQLTEQQVKLSESVVAAAAVESSLRNQTTASQVEHDRQRDEHRARLEATERVVSDQEGRLKASTALMAERSNAVIDELSNAERRQQKLAVQQTEISDGVTANRQKLAAISGVDLQNEIDLAVKASFDARLEPAMEELVAAKYVVTAPTTGTGGINPKLENGSDKAFLAQQVGDDATERAVARALKKAGAQ